MGIRMSGIISGLDTDAIVKELMSAHSLKKTKVDNKITKHNWKEEKWKELNSKIYALYTGSLSNLKAQGSYMAKKAASSNETKVSVKASNNAVEGSHTIQVKQLASSQYLTSGKLESKDADGNPVAVNSATKLVDLGTEDLRMTAGTTINIESGNKSYSFDVSESSNINDFVNACKQVGLSATYDTAQGRLFISSSSSGTDNAFSITAVESGATLLRNDIRDAIGYSSMASATRIQVDKALYTYTDEEASPEDKEDAINLIYEKLIDHTTVKTKNDIITEFNKPTDEQNDLYKSAYDKLTIAQEEAREKYLNSLPGRETNVKFSQVELDKAVNKAISDATTEYVKGKLSDFNNAVEDEEDEWNPYADAVNGSDDSDGLYSLMDELKLFEGVEVEAENQLKNLKLSIADADDASLVEASNSQIVYNGAVLENSSNTITANGLTFTVQDVTAENESITLTVSKDTDAVYKTIKTFLTEYNELLDEMNKLYGANSARGYEPLTDEEREAMTEDQIEKWETKIKDSLLRRDSSLSSLISVFKDSLVGGVEYNGKSYSLSSFGISTKYYTENGKLHIAGDSEDTLTSEDKDKLMAALQDDPDAVMNVISSLGQKLYDNVNAKLKSSSLSSAMTIYNDKQMKKELSNYEEQIKKMETKLKDLEERYYKQFTAMEKAMSNLTSQGNTLASMMGMNTQQ